MLPILSVTFDSFYSTLGSEDDARTGFLFGKGFYSITHNFIKVQKDNKNW